MFQFCLISIRAFYKIFSFDKFLDSLYCNILTKLKCLLLKVAHIWEQSFHLFFMSNVHLVDVHFFSRVG